MTRLWLTPTKSIDFSEIERDALAGEFATRAQAWDYAGTLGLLPDPDPVLRKHPDGGVAALEALTSDAHLLSVIQQRKLGTLSCEFSWSGGQVRGETSPAAEKLAADLAADLENVDLYSLVSGILDAPYYGNTPVELVWEASGGRLNIADLQAKPSRWFAYDEQNVLKFRSQESPWGGSDVPFGKFVIARHFPTYDNPYGLRLLSRCLWPVAFKKGGVKFWLQLAEKFGVPFLVGKYAPGTSPGEQQNMLSNLAAMVQSAVAVIPQGGEVQILDGAQKASADIHRTLKEAMDAEVSKVIMGQTLTAEVGDKGSYAAGKVHAEVLDDFRAADKQLVKTAMEEIAWLYAKVNAPGVPSPVFNWFEADDPQADFADRDKTLSESGVRFTRDYFKRRYRLRDDDFELTPAPRDAAVAARSTSFAETEPDRVDLLTVDLDAQTQAKVQATIDKVRGLVKRAGSLEEIRDGIAELYDGKNSEELGLVIGRALALADLSGRAEVQDGH